MMAIEEHNGRVTATFAYLSNGEGNKVKKCAIPVHLLSGNVEEIAELEPVLNNQFGPGKIIMTDDLNMAKETLQI